MKPQSQTELQLSKQERTREIWTPGAEGAASPVDGAQAQMKKQEDTDDKSSGTAYCVRSYKLVMINL